MICNANLSGLNITTGSMELLSGTQCRNGQKEILNVLTSNDHKIALKIWKLVQRTLRHATFKHLQCSLPFCEIESILTNRQRLLESDQTQNGGSQGKTNLGMNYLENNACS